MEEQILSDKKSYNSKEFFEIHEIQRYCNDKNDGRHVVFNVIDDSDYHMYFLTKGSLRIKNNTSVYQLGEYDLFIYRPSGRQDLISTYMTSYVHCIFSGKDVASILKKLDFSCNVIYHLLTSYESGDSYLYINKQIEYVRSEKRKKKLNYELSSSCMFIEFLVLCSRHIDTENDNKNIQYIKQIISYISDNIEKDIDVNTLMEMAHLSKSRFYALFKQYTGTSPLKFQNNFRLSAAADFLALYDLKIQDVAKKVGFSDPLYFSKLFKKEFGISPKKYSRIHKEYTPIQNKDEQN